MSIKQNIEDKLDADEFADTALDFLWGEGLQIMEASRDEPPMTQKQDRHISKTISRELRKEEPRRWKKIPVVVAVVLVALYATYADAIRTAIGNFVLDNRGDYIDFSDRHLPDNYVISTETPMPRIIPEGYQLIQVSEPDGLTTLTYANDSHQNIYYLFYGEGSAVRLDSEDADQVTSISIKGQEGVCIEKQGRVTLFWGNSPTYQLSGPIKEKQSLFDMAHSIEPIGKPGSNKNLEDD